MTNRGLRVSLPLLPDGHARQPEDWGILNCRYNDSIEHTIALRLGRSSRWAERHVVVSDFSRSVLEGGSVMSPRLGLVHANDVESATLTDILIARRFERDSGNVRIKLHVDPTGGDRSHDYVGEIFTEQDTATPRAPVFLTTQKPVARAGVMLQYPSGRKFSLVFGFDRYPPNDTDGVLLPGVWAKFHRGHRKLKDIIKLEALHPHGREYTCTNPREAGCPYMPKMARVSLLPEGDLLEASITHEHIFDEDVFMVRVIVTQLHELEAPLNLPSCENDRQAVSPSDGPVGVITKGRGQPLDCSAEQAPLARPPMNWEEIPDCFVPELRSGGGFTDTLPAQHVSKTAEMILSAPRLQVYLTHSSQDKSRKRG